MESERSGPIPLTPHSSDTSSAFSDEDAWPANAKKQMNRRRQRHIGLTTTRSATVGGAELCWTLNQRLSTVFSTQHRVFVNRRAGSHCTPGARAIDHSAASTSCAVRYPAPMALSLAGLDSTSCAPKWMRPIACRAISRGDGVRITWPPLLMGVP